MTITFRAGPWLPAKRPLAEGQGFVAIGDVHGCDDQLAVLHDGIRGLFADDKADPANFTAIHLGDYMDRGPKCLQALDRIRTQPIIAGAHQANLYGNHEDLMMKALDQPSEQNMFFWSMNGGHIVIQNLGVPEDPTKIREAMGMERLDWVADLFLFHRIGDWYFCHAGINPAKSLNGQSANELMWIRYEFLGYEGPFDQNVCVVHGHTPGPPDLTKDNKVSLDSGCFYTGVMSGLYVLGDRMRLVQAGTAEGYEKVDEWGARLEEQVIKARASKGPSPNPLKNKG